MRARLVAVAGIAEPPVVDLFPEHTIYLGRDPKYLGHDPKNFVLVRDDVKVSRLHTEVFFSEGTWKVRNRSEVNKTWLDGKRITQVTSLHDGQIIGVSAARFRFEMVALEQDSATTPADLVVLPPRVVEATGTSRYSSLDAEELTTLVEFMDASLHETTSHGLVTLALRKAQQRTGASVCGFLGLDHEDAQLKVVLPVQAEVDIRLSRQLTAKVRSTECSVWLGGPAGRDDIENSASLDSYLDALCVPVRRGPSLESPSKEIPAGQPKTRADSTALGALHVYHFTQVFTDRDRRFCEELGICLANTLHVLRSRRALEADNSRLREHAGSTGDELLGNSQAIRQLRGDVAFMAQSPCTVLIEGESGVGKELVALGLHRQSPRRDGPLVTINCAALNAGLNGAEFFGHVKGTFTHAVSDRSGLFQQADEGTIFLDEIGELSADDQARLLRVLENKRVRPVGSNAEITVDVRIIAATNRDLEKEMKEGRFRRDLFYRLGARLHVPPLRDHAEDIPALAAHFLKKLNHEYRREIELSPDAVECLQAYSWPGNVRQLRSVLETAVAMARENLLRPPSLRLGHDDGGARDSLNLEELEARAIAEALRRTNNVLVQAARLLGIHRETLINKMKKYGIRPRHDVVEAEGVG
jgi:two-component system, NtrC family, response regulator HydG